MPVAKRRQLKAGVLTRIAAGGSVVLAASEAAGAGLWASTLGAAIKGAAAFAVVASIGAGGYFAMRPAQRVPAQVAPRATSMPVAGPETKLEPRQPVPSAVVASPPQTLSHPAPRPKPPARVAERPSPAPAAVAMTAPAVDSSSLTEETRLLREADRAIRAGDRERAMALLNDHATRFPDGNLAPERLAERMVILCEEGKADASAGARFLAMHPGSALTARLKQSCGMNSMPAK